MWGRIVFAVAVLSIPMFCPAQSLGEVARKEKERREKNKTQGVEVREITEDEVFEDEDEAVEDESSESAEDLETAETEPPEERRIDLSLDDDADAARANRESRERRRSEAEWRARLQRARARVNEAREGKEALAGLHLAQGESYVDGQGRTVVESLDHLRRLVREADEELVAAEQSLVDLREEARRAGVPPGWLR